MAEKRESLLYPEFKWGDWILKKYLGSKDGFESWQAMHISTGEIKDLDFDFTKVSPAFMEQAKSTPIEQLVIERTPKGQFEAQQSLDQWQLIKPLGNGVNAEVWLATDGKQDVALKIFIGKHPIKYEKFCNEITILNYLAGSHLGPSVIESNTTEDFNVDKTYWLAMKPVKLLIDELQQSNQLIRLVKSLIEYASITKELAEKKIFYTDLKLEHLAECDGHVMLIDYDGAKLNFAEDFVDGQLKPNQNHFIITQLLRRVEDFLHQQSYEYTNFLGWLDSAKKLYSLDDFISLLRCWQDQRQADPILP